MYGNSLDGLPGCFMVVGAAIGLVLAGIGWAIFVYGWPWLKALIHAVTA